MVRSGGGPYPPPVAYASAPRFYEVRCPHCETSFPPEARRCLHCGRRLGGAIVSGEASGLAGASTLREAPRSARETWTEAGAEAAHSAGTAEEAEELGGRGAGGALWIATAALAVLGSVLRTCQGG